MGFNLLAAAAGAASAVADKLDEDRKYAQLRGTEAAKGLYARYTKVMEENRKKQDETAERVSLLSAAFPDASDAEIQTLAAKPAVFDLVATQIKEGTFDKSIKLPTLTGLATNNVETTAVDRLKEMPDLLNQVREKYAPATPSVEKQTEEGFFAKNRRRGYETGLMETAQALGVSVEELQKTKAWQPKYADNKADYSGFIQKKQDTFTGIENKAKTERVNELVSGGMSKPAAFQKVNEEFKAKEKEDYASATFTLIKDITALKQQGKKDEAAKLQFVLDEYKRQHSTKDGKEDGAAKAASNNLISSAINRTYLNAISAALPVGTVTIVDGSPQISSMVSDEKKQDAITKIRKALYQANTTNGVPKSEGHLLGLSQAGILFDTQGKLLTKGIVDDEAPSATTSTGLGARPASTAGLYDPQNKLTSPKETKQPATQTTTPAPAKSFEDQAANALKGGASLKAVKDLYKRKTGKELPSTIAQLSTTE
jgi:uncharacterized protein YoaH (UPF0181 family)